VSDETRRRLEEAGRRTAPAPDPAFADRLEARLLAVAESPEPGPAGGAPAPVRRPRRRWLVLAGATVGALAVAVVLLSSRVGEAPVPLALAQPVNVEVALRDGTVLADPDGFELPDGAVITVGEGGSARIGRVLLRPGDVATIESGRVRVEHDQPIGALPETTAPATPRPTERTTPRPSREPERTPRPTAESTRKPGATPKPDRTPKPTPEPTAPPATPAPTPTSPPPTAEPTPTPGPTSPALTARPRLRAHANPAGNRVLVRWTATRRAASYVVVVTRSRIGPAPEPVYPGARFARTFDAAPERWIRFRVLDPVVEVRVMVVALGRHGHEVSRSRIVTVATGDTLGGVVDDPPPPPGDDPPADPDPPPDEGG
jgi:hypothetical protein